MPLRRFATHRLLAPLAVAGLLLAVGCGEAPTAQGPNVLWICVDVLRADRLGVYGYDAPTSPRLDALAREGALFLDAFAQSSWTKPSVPSFLTSTYPVEHGVLEGSTQDEKGRIVSDVLAPRFVTAAEIFRAGGWATGAFVTNAQLRPFLGFDQGFDVYEEELGRAREINDRFESWLDGAGRPFFAYLHYLDVHWPYRPEETYQALFPSPPTDLDFTGPGAPSLADRINAGRVALRDEDRRAIRARYDALVRQVDAAIAELLDALEARHLRERTIVVVSSDHGEELFEHGLLGHGRSLRDTLLHVPLILAGPGVPAGRVVDARVESIDILPTLLELASLPAPAQLRGRSLVPLLAPPAAAPGPDAATAERPVFSQLLRRGSFHRSVRVGGWKLVEDFRFRDPGEAPHPTGRLALEPGRRVSVKGAFGDDGVFLARAFDVEEDDGGPEVLRGVVSALAREEGWMQVGPFRVDLPSGLFAYRERERWWPIGPDALEVGSIVEIDGEVVAPRRLRADRVELRVDPREALQVKLEGPATVVSAQAPARLRVLGVEVAFEPDVALPGIRLAGGHDEARPLDEASLEDPRVTRRHVALYHVAEDPDERHDVADDHPERVAQLAALLRREPVARTGSGEADAARRSLDDETVERLRALGYLD